MWGGAPSGHGPEGAHKGPPPTQPPPRPYGDEEPSSPKNLPMRDSGTGCPREFPFFIYQARRIMMTDDLGAHYRTAYEARPWLKHYPSYIPAELTPRFTNGLEMFLATVKAMPEQVALYYFDQAMS